MVGHLSGDCYVKMRISLTCFEIPNFLFSKQNFALKSYYEIIFFDSEAFKCSFIFPINLFGITCAEVLSEGKGKLFQTLQELKILR